MLSKNHESTSGWLLIDKPSNMSSRRAGAIAARAIGAKTFGHIGTLDPMASGLLPIAFGDATKMIPFFGSEKKEYLFSIVWGIETDTLDITGTVVKSSDDRRPTTDDLCSVCAALVGDIMQTPPQYSAVSVDGVRAYKAARAGKTVEIPPRQIRIYKLEYLKPGTSNLKSCFRVVCSPGTYVRVLAQQICEQLNNLTTDDRRLVCTVDTIRRTKTNGFDIKDTVLLDFPENLVNNLKSVDFGLGDIPVWDLNKNDADMFLHGGFVTSNQLPVTSGLYRIYHNDKFLGIGTVADGILKPKRVIN
jgi:tRNA pseudouridine55 synthase